tara:strand:- start:187 stop:456 length:270 start_codon:yes stop_codon:yes gene_type:complete
MNNKKNPILRSKESRQIEVSKIINSLNNLELSPKYDEIKNLYKILQTYVNNGGKFIINIPFPLINKRIKGLLPDTVNEECFLTLVHEKF